MTRQLITVALLVSLSGCFGDGKVSVSGNVSVAGTPVDQGTIRFAPADGKGPAEGATVESGEYRVRLTSGEKNVQIEGHKQVGMAKQNPDDPSSPTLPVFEPIVNANVTANISSGQSNLDFDLPTP